MIREEMPNLTEMSSRIPDAAESRIFAATYRFAMKNAVSGFSGLTKDEKIEWLAQAHFSNPSDAKALLRGYWNADDKLQQLHDDFLER